LIGARIALPKWDMPGGEWSAMNRGIHGKRPGNKS